MTEHTTPAPTPELLPCPFCGGKPTSDVRLRDGCQHGEPDAYAYFISCVSCAATGPWFKTGGNAIRGWNRRTPTAAASQPDAENRLADVLVAESEQLQADSIPTGWRLELSARLMETARGLRSLSKLRERAGTVQPESEVVQREVAEPSSTATAPASSSAASEGAGDLDKLMFEFENNLLAPLVRTNMEYCLSEDGVDRDEAHDAYIAVLKAYEAALKYAAALRQQVAGSKTDREIFAQRVAFHAIVKWERVHGREPDLAAIAAALAADVTLFEVVDETDRWRQAEREADLC